ncbi:hypothetical protein EXT68_02435 [Pectobacterium parmentieri]|nr:hypothetical protein FEV48_11845 [Pectobacterium carotovorum subsp. carotovorum]MCL6354376.1 hypothetical protein [Pectobacterium parmentieri]QHP60531.1 hypothetical protein EH204_13350 [Pectobacterium carotovorum subsp. carotovorum]
MSGIHSSIISSLLLILMVITSG